MSTASTTDYQQKYLKYKSENKRLRRDMLTLKSKTEEMAALMAQSQIESDKLMSSKKRLETNLKESREREKHLLTAVEQGMQDEGNLLNSETLKLLCNDSLYNFLLR
jgi:predicted  nucleic acid-binding Zn-ribbon protein